MDVVVHMYINIYRVYDMSASFTVQCVELFHICSLSCVNLRKTIHRFQEQFLSMIRVVPYLARPLSTCEQVCMYMYTHTRTHMYVHHGIS